ncbi:hypothetical protein ALC56_05377, partial [Trachymyrmex septentrionalis]
VLEYSKYSWKYRKRLGDYLTPVPRPRSNVECARREIRGGYLIYVIERARGGYLNNVIRILSHRSINAFRSYRTVRFCPGKAGNAMASGSWTGKKLTRVDI